MKNFALLMCILITGSYYAQEENHLKGTMLLEEHSENGIKQAFEKRHEMVVDVYPNPSQGNLFVDGAAGATVTIYSSEGTYVGTWIIGTEEKVEITDLPQGTFLCTILDGTTRTMKRIVVI